MLHAGGNVTACSGTVVIVQLSACNSAASTCRYAQKLNTSAPSALVDGAGQHAQQNSILHWFGFLSYGNDVAARLNSLKNKT